MLQRLGIRRALALIFGVPCLLFTAAALAYQAFFGEGSLVIVAPEDVELEFQVDGRPSSLSGGSHEKVSVKQGPHTVKLKSARGEVTRSVEVKNGFASLLVPADDEQCFVQLDVSKSNYQYGSKAADKYPRITRRIGATDVVDLPTSIHFSEAELPRELKEGHSCDLLLEVECDALKLADAELFTMLGFD